MAAVVVVVVVVVVGCWLLVVGCWLACLKTFFVINLVLRMTFFLLTPSLV